MPVLYFSKSDENTRYVKSKMTDAMWRSIVVKLGNSCFLELDDGTLVTSPEKIVQQIKSGLPNPNVLERLVNVLSALRRIWRRYLDGETIRASDREIHRRRDLCENCPFNKRKLLARQCEKCGCIIRLKTASAAETCPIDKW